MLACLGHLARPAQAPPFLAARLSPVWSSDPDTMRDPSALMATDVTTPAWGAPLPCLGSTTSLPRIGPARCPRPSASLADPAELWPVDSDVAVTLETPAADGGSGVGKSEPEVRSVPEEWEDAWPRDVAEVVLWPCLEPVPTSTEI